MSEIDANVLADADQTIAKAKRDIAYMVSHFPGLVAQHGHVQAITIAVSTGVDIFSPREMALLAVVAIDMLAALEDQAYAEATGRAWLDAALGGPEARS